MMKPEARMTNEGAAPHASFGHSSLIRHSGFVIRHSRSRRDWLEDPRAVGPLLLRRDVPYRVLFFDYAGFLERHRRGALDLAEHVQQAEADRDGHRADDQPEWAEDLEAAEDGEEHEQFVQAGAVGDHLRAE